MSPEGQGTWCWRLFQNRVASIVKYKCDTVQGAPLDEQQGLQLRVCPELQKLCSDINLFLNVGQSGSYGKECLELGKAMGQKWKEK